MHACLRSWSRSSKIYLDPTTSICRAQRARAVWTWKDRFLKPWFFDCSNTFEGSNSHFFSPSDKGKKYGKSYWVELGTLFKHKYHSTRSIFPYSSKANVFVIIEIDLLLHLFPSALSCLFVLVRSLNLPDTRKLLHLRCLASSGSQSISSMLLQQQPFEILSHQEIVELGSILVVGTEGGSSEQQQLPTSDLGICFFCKLSRCPCTQLTCAYCNHKAGSY